MRPGREPTNQLAKWMVERSTAEEKTAICSDRAEHIGVLGSYGAQGWAVGRQAAFDYHDA